MKRGKFKRTPEIIQKHRESMLKRYAEPKVRRELSEIMKRYYQDHPHSRKGKKHSPETKQKMRLAMFHRLEKLKKEGKPHFLKGRKIPEEQKRKMRLAKLGMYDGPKNPAWKGGRKKCGGYIFIWSPHHPFAGKSRYIKENRLIVEKHICRFLKPEEACHHINGIKDDNRPENLMAFKSDSLHQLFEHGHPTDSSDIIFDGRKL